MLGNSALKCEGRDATKMETRVNGSVAENRGKPQCTINCKAIIGRTQRRGARLRNKAEGETWENFLTLELPRKTAVDWLVSSPITSCLAAETTLLPEYPAYFSNGGAHRNRGRDGAGQGHLHDHRRGDPAARVKEAAARTGW